MSRHTHITTVLRNKLRGIGMGHVLTEIVPHELTERRTGLLWVQHASSKLHIKHKPLTREAAATQCLELRFRVCHDLRSITAQPAFKREQIGVASGPRKLNSLVAARDTGTYHLAVKHLEFEAKPGRSRGSYPREPVGKSRPDHNTRGRGRWGGGGRGAPPSTPGSPSTGAPCTAVVRSPEPSSAVAPPADTFATASFRSPSSRVLNSSRSNTGVTAARLIGQAASSSRVTSSGTSRTSSLSRRFRIAFSF